MTTSSESLAVLDRTMDVDAHEMTPSHLWGEVFGENAARIADLAEPVLKKTGANDFYNPDVVADDLPATEDNVWNVRGTRAPGAFDMRRRLEVMDVMGIERQLVFPSYALFANHLYAGNDFTFRDRYGLTMPENEIRDIGYAGLCEYNEWVVRSASYAPDRIRPVAYVSPGTDVEDLYRRTKELLDQGVRAINLPAGVPPGGHSPAHPDLDPYWSMLAERNVAFVMHVGGEAGFVQSAEWGRAPAFKPGKVESHELGSEPHAFATVSYPVCNFLTCMALGGVFERHPGLRVGAIELGAGWFGPLADNLDMWARDVYATRMKPFISRLPSEYLADQVRVTPFNNFEPVDQYIQRYPRLLRSYCYSTDYPHIEGGTDIKRKFVTKLSPLGDEVMKQFFRNNGELLLPGSDAADVA